jgi:hypothetical protein
MGISVLKKPTLRKGVYTEMNGVSSNLYTAALMRRTALTNIYLFFLFSITNGVI